ncbi:glycoside hydrolase family 88/105 protein [Algoriphagus winogradskyi]|uniref:Unsaturated rhamnogalacturonyl hydrolase n=1 Tax=Algoriphagus winogradskyi TaxID=237017 RepID=A0ABY1P0J6_9BACT|nr:glycoside hydrolase family 88 protein [Algoriphagus winogradskyi]SMP23481.1 unsaturated rhamnogalacturonyl hydrolase [Algoriphagus winogradskyi]
MLKLLKNSSFVLLSGALLLGCSAEKSVENIEVESVPKKDYSIWMADSEIARNPEGWTIDFNQKPKWEYTHGLIMSSMQAVWKQKGEQRFYDYTKKFADFMVDSAGNILTYKKSDFNIDRVNGGKFLINLYEESGEQKYKLAVDELRDQMRTHPRNKENGFWHKKIYPHQMWLDGLYMGSPFLAQYATAFDEPALFDDVANQILLMDKYGYSEETGLYHHAWDESKEQKWADPETGLSTNYWGRSIGWFAMALVDVLDFLPEDHPKRNDIIAIAQKLAKGIQRYQTPEGVWYQVVDQGTREGNYLESSASGMFTYFLLKGAEKGYLDQDDFTAGKKAYEGMLAEFIREDADGGISLTNVCGVAGLGGNPYRDGSYEYYVGEEIRVNDPKGVGPFILASLQYESLAK